MYIGPGLRLSPHQNVAATIAVALDEPFRLRTWSAPAAWSDWRLQVSSLIPSGTLHHLESSGPMVFLYLDPVTDRRHPLTQVALDGGRERLLRVGPSIGIHEAFAGFGIQSRLPGDARIAKVVLAIDRCPAAFGRIREAAELACLSPSRFRALFDAEVGLPFRRYRLWRRMAIVLRAIARGSSLTSAAFEAGFASSAHLSSSFKRMFGLSASELMALGGSIDISEDQVVPTNPAFRQETE